MRVLLLNNRLSDRGGADRWLLGVLARLQEVAETLLAVGHVDPHLHEDERARIHPWVQVKGLDCGRPGRQAGTAAVARLAELVSQFEPDVVLTNDIVDPGLLSAVADTGRGVAMVQDHRCFCPGRGMVDGKDVPCADPMDETCLRCFVDIEYGRTLLMLTRMRLAPVKRMARVLVLSQYMADALTAVGVPRERLVVIPPFVDRLEPDAASDAAAGEHHLLAGRLSEHKGVAVALEAAQAMQGELPLVVAGDGPLADEVVAAADGKRIIFSGWADRERLAVLLSRARSLWLPSLWAEPFGIVGLEAMAAGVPVIAADVGGVRDWLVPEQTGLLVKPGDAQALAEAADRLDEHLDLARTLGQAGRRRVADEFDADELFGRLVKTLNEVKSG